MQTSTGRSTRAAESEAQVRAPIRARVQTRRAATEPTTSTARVVVAEVALAPPAQQGEPARMAPRQPAALEVWPPRTSCEVVVRVARAAMRYAARAEMAVVLS